MCGKALRFSEEMIKLTQRKIETFVLLFEGGWNMLYEYLTKNYRENEPILLSDIQIEGMSDGNLRQQIKKLSDDGRIKRYDAGIYFIPKKSIFQSGTQLSLNDVIRYKYLQDETGLCGYVSGLEFANQLGITTQVPMKKEIVTNKATKDYRETTLARSSIIIRKSRIRVTQDNYKALQLLDLLKDIDVLAEVTGEMLSKKLISYMKSTALTFDDIDLYLDYYPEKIYKNLYKVGLLNGVFTS